MVIYQDIPVIRKNTWNGTKTSYGDIPVGSINTITGKFEPCVNNRGRAYAARNRLSYRSKKS